VEEAKVLGPERVRAGDVLIGLASTGLHTNGYSLARRIVAERLKLRSHDPFPGNGGARPTCCWRCTAPTCRCCATSCRVHAMAHITGGGLPGNLNRALPPTLDARVVLASSWEVPNTFRVLGGGGQRGATRCSAPSTWASA
jgi:phosphoribosylformylglycinamidine cyclo-ligase